MYGRNSYPMGALKACTSRVNGHNANSAMPMIAWIWYDAGACIIASPSGCRFRIERNHTDTESR